MDATAGHVAVLRHADPGVPEVVGADPGRQPPVIDQRRHRLAEAVRGHIRDAELLARVDAVSGIDRTGAQQLTLPFAGEPACVDEAVDRVRRRYGKSALTRGVLIGRDPGLEMPHLPD